jgi:hypothetical protein
MRKKKKTQVTGEEKKNTRCVAKGGK